MSSSTTTQTTQSDVVRNVERQNRVFNLYMAVYGGQAYHTAEQQGWVYDMISRDPELCRTTLIYPSENDNSMWGRAGSAPSYGMDVKITEVLMYPTPVYWGKARDDMFDWSAVERGFGYNERRATRMPDELRDTVQYAIVGRVRVKAHGDVEEHDSHVIHTEGVNLESVETPAFKSVVGIVRGGGVTRAKSEILADYYERHRQVLKLIIEAAASQVDFGAGETAFIQAPMIGAGCFLRGVTELGLDVGEFLQQQVFAMISVLNMSPPEYKFVYKLCIFNTTEFSNDIVAAYQRLAEGDPRFELGMDKSGGNVLANVPRGNYRQKVFVVNAGDAHSFIGNGMKHERSVEGFVVANAQGYNPQWQNTSFLHNAYFNPDIFTPEKAALSGRQVWKATMEW